MNPKAIECFQKSKEIAHKISNEELEIKALGSIGNVYKSKSEWFDAMSYYKNAEAIYEKSKQKKRLKKSESVTVNNMGTIYQLLGQYELADEYFEKSFELSIEAGNKRQAINALNNLGANNLSLKKLDEAMTYYQQAYRLSKEPQLMDLAGNELINISAIYGLKKQYSLELKTLKSADSLFQIFPDKEKSLNILINYGSYFTETKNYSKALEYFNESLKLSDSIGSKDFKVKCLTNIGYVNYKLGKYNLAIKYSVEAANLSKKFMLTQYNDDANKIIDNSNTAIHGRKINQEYLIIVLILILVFLITLGIRKRNIPIKKIEFLALGSMFLFFELMNLYFHSIVSKITDDNPFWMLLIMVLFISILTSLHNYLIKWIRAKLSDNDISAQ